MADDEAPRIPGIDGSVPPTSLLGVCDFFAKNQGMDVMEVDLREADEGHRRQLSALLADQVRLDVLRNLEEADGPLSLADLAITLAREEVDAEGDKWVRAECYRIQLGSVHVPSLEEAGLVEYDERRGTVSLSPSATERRIDEALDVTSET